MQDSLRGCLWCQGVGADPGVPGLTKAPGALAPEKRSSSLNEEKKKKTVFKGEWAWIKGQEVKAAGWGLLEDSEARDGVSEPCAGCQAVYLWVTSV